MRLKNIRRSLLLAVVVSVYCSPVLSVPFAQGISEVAAPEIVTTSSASGDDKVGDKVVDKIITIVNDDIITRNELIAEINFIKKQLRQQSNTLPSEAVLQKQILERLIVKHLQLQMAERARIRIDDETLNRNILNIASSNKMSLSQFRDVLERDGFDFAQYRKSIREEIAISRLRQRQVNSRVNVTEQEIEDFLANKSLLDNLDGEFNVAHILVEVPEAASSEQVQQSKAKAQEALEKIQAGEEFTKIAASYSDGQLALEGGDLGWRKLGQLPVLFSTAVTNMKVNDIRGLIRSPSGFHIIKLNDKRSNERKNIIKQTNARHILIKTNELLTNRDAWEKLDQLKQRVGLGDSFSDLALSHSDDTVTASKGGDLGWVSPGDLVPEFEKTMNALSVNQVSDPFKTQFGWHIIQLLERRDFDNTEQSISLSARKQIRQRKIEEETQNWLRRIRDEAYVEIRL